MEAVKKYSLWGIFISIIGVFAMSHNASAFNVSDTSSYDLVNRVRGPALTCTYSDNTSTSSGSYGCNTYNNGYLLKGIATQSPNSFKNKDIVEVDLLLYSYTQGSSNRIAGLLDTYSFPTGVFLLSIDEVQSDEMAHDVSTDGLSLGYAYIYRYHLVFLIGQDITAIPFSIFALGSSMDFIRGNNGYLRIYDLKTWRKNNNSSTDQQNEINETNNSVNNSQSAGGSSSQDAQTGTTGLLSAIGSAVNVISSASPTNCRINGNMGNLDMGQLDLCANPAPAFIQTIGSLILILMCVPLAISLFNRFIALFRSFQS